jgi:D-alanyl-D-alanine carboxypeptidase (penicillin-binding protein 5/6)
MFKTLVSFSKPLSIALLVVSLNSMAQIPAPTPTLGQASATQAAVPAPVPSAPLLDASGFILVDGETGEVLAQNNADQRLPPASLTKMMSSYLVIEELVNGRINETNMVNISVKAWKMEGSRMYVKEGTQVPVIDLLRGEIIQSGNDATVALAEYVGGTEDAFVSMMNKKAKELGMTSTHYVNAAGLPAEEHYTTARDLATLARAIIFNHPQHYPLFAEKEFKYNNIRQPNRNRLLFLDPTVDGLKTGHTEEAGYCLVASSKREGTRLIAVILGTKSDKDRASETQKLLAYGFRYFETVGLYKANVEVTKGRVWSGKAPEVVLGLAKDVRMSLPRGRSGDLKANVHVNETIKAPILAGQELGRLTIELDGKVINTQPLVALQPVEEASFFARLWDKIKLFFRGLFS